MATSSLEEHDLSVAAATAALDSQLPMQSNNIICRGITNANGTGCHTSSALQLLFHCFPRLREDLLNLSNVSANYTAQQSLSSTSTSDEENNSVKAIEKEFVYQLSWFFYLLANAEDIIAIAQEASSSSAAIPESRTKQKQNKRKKSKRKKKAIHEKKAAAIDAFVTKSREGKTNMHEWRNLVDAMKELNRKKYDEALGQVMNRRSSDEERSGTGGQHIGNLGGGRKSATCELSSSTLEGAGDAIDPTKFYEQLMSYTVEAMEARHHINTNNVGDAAVVFRCLVATLEFSINHELTRLDELIGLFEIDNWNDGETKEGDDNLPSAQRNAYELRSSLAKVKDAMDYEWKGNLLSRIVGINQTGEVSSDNIITTTTTTRTKKNGNIERPIPIPWQLPVLAQTDNAKPNEEKDKVDDSTRSYFESLSTSLHSVTICPNPIRGYNWNGLVKSGDVNEETTITKMDMNGNFLVDKEEEAKDSSEELEAIKSTSPVEEPIVIKESKDDEEKGSEEFKSLAITAHSDDVSVISTTSRASVASVASVSSRTIGTQTDLGDVEVKTITVRTSTVTTESETSSELETQKNEKAVGGDADTSAGIGVGDTTETVSETSSSKDASSQNSAIKFAIKKDACYAAAVTALSTASKARRSPRRDKPKKVPAASVSSAPARNERDMCYAAAVAALAGSAAIRNVAMDDIEVSYTTSNPINSDDEISHVFSDESNSESSLDSKVPSADDEPSVASSETHSSAIDTPSDIDDISLGSWTDSEADEEKKNDDEPLITDIYPVIRAQECHDAKATANADEKAVSPSVQEKAEASDVVPTEIAHSVCSNSVLAVSTLNSDSASSSSDDSSTSSSSSSSTSSTGSDSTSSTDSSSTSSSSSSSDSSSSDRDAAIIEGTENYDEENIAYNNNSTKKKEWTTRKETRFCQPLPRSLIFHLKRSTFTPAGHGEKLPGSLDIPEELNLRTCCLEQQQDDDESSSEHYCYQLTGALVHVDPVLSEDEKDHLDYGAMSEGHYVTFICKSAENKQGNKTWIELDDEFVRVVGSSGDESSADTALNVLSGCDVSNNEESCGTSTSSKRVVKGKERRYATLVVYSRKS